LWERDNEVDFVNKNRQVVSNWDLVNQSRMEESRVISIRKGTDAVHRKEQLEELERKKKIFYLYKWDFLRQKRNEQEVRINQIIQKQQLATQWVKHQSVLVTLKAVF
jgi:hypothetical protein